MTVRAGDIVIVSFPGVTGVKRRPAVVLSSDSYHSTRPDVIVGLVTSQTAAALGPTDCLLEDWREAGLRVSSAFRAFLVTLPPSAKPMVVGHLSDRDWLSVQRCLVKALAPLPAIAEETEEASDRKDGEPASGDPPGES